MVATASFAALTVMHVALSRVKWVEALRPNRCLGQISTRRVFSILNAPPSIQFRSAPNGPTARVFSEVGFLRGKNGGLLSAPAPMSSKNLLLGTCYAPIRLFAAKSSGSPTGLINEESVSVGAGQSTAPLPSRDPRIYVLQFDGGSRGNPGVSGAGAVLCSAALSAAPESSPLPCAEEVCTREVWVGDSHTNNYAEYMGLIEGLRMAVEMGVSDVVVQGDSKLVIKQMTGEFVVRSASLRPLWEEARRLLSSIPQHRFEHIPRSANARADELANRAMDRRQGVRASGGSTPNGDNLLGQK